MTWSKLVPVGAAFPDNLSLNSYLHPDDGRPIRGIIVYATVSEGGNLSWSFRTFGQVSDDEVIGILTVQSRRIRQENKYANSPEI